MTKKANELKALIRKVWDKRNLGEHGWFQKAEDAWITIEPSDSDDEDILFLEEVSKIDSLGYPDGVVRNSTSIWYDDIIDDDKMNYICEEMLKGVKKKWKIPVTWEMFGCVEVEADTIEEAMAIARDDDCVLDLPKGEYVDSSWKLTYENPEEIREGFNDNQDDYYF